MFKLTEDKKTFSCSFCGISYRKSIPAGSVYLSCRHCGATFFVPPQLGGSVHYCSNHPENQAIGLCDDCKKGYCDHCLHILTFHPFSRVRSLSIFDKKLHLCSKCLRKRKIRIGMKGLSLGILLILVALFLSPYTSLPPGGQPIPNWQIILIASVFVTAFIGLLVLAYGWISFFIPEPTVHEKRESVKCSILKKGVITLMLFRQQKLRKLSQKL